MGLGLHSAIHIAKMGMGAAEKSINVSGNNLANANTYGYKAERADFASFLSYNYSYGFPSQTSDARSRSAGTNPLQIGMGVELAGVTTNFTQGAFQEGMTNSDIAINGNGFLIVQSASFKYTDNNVTPPEEKIYGSVPYYTRNGSLKLSGDLYLTTNSGMYVMGYGVNDQYQIQDKLPLTALSIPIGQKHIAEATTQVTIEGVLDAVGDSGTQGTVLATTQMADLSNPVPLEGTGTVEQLTRPVTENQTSGTGINAGGNIEEGQYLYRFVYVDAQGVESDFSAPTDPIEVAAGQNAITLSGLPALEAGYTSLRIYRAVDPRVNDPNASTDSAEYFRVAEIDPSQTNPPDTYVDTRSTVSISDPSGAGYQTLSTERLSGNYQYYITYVDKTGAETRPSLLVDGVVINPSGQVELSNIPNPDSSTWSACRIYRCTDNDPTTFYRVGEISTQDTTNTFIDRLSDASLVTQSVMSWAGTGSQLATESTKLIHLGKYDNGQFYQVFETGTLTLTPQKGNEELRVASMEITATTTVADYLNFLKEAYAIRSGDVPADQGAIGQLIKNGTQGAHIIDGAMYLLGNSGVENALVLDGYDMQLTTTANKTVFIDLGWQTTAQEAVGSSVATDLQVYDSLGAPVSIRLTFVLESKSNTQTVYRWYADSPQSQPSEGNAIASGTGTLTFGQNGELIDSSDTTIHVQRTQVASTSPLKFDFEMNVNAVKAIATSSPGVIQSGQDGASAGTLYDYQIDESGIIWGLFSNGDQRPLGQIVLATFVNQDGLINAGDSLFRSSVTSGDPKIYVPGTGGAGTIRSNSLELSNADIGQEIVNMILASAMYRANAKVMTTSNEMFDAMLRII